MKSHHLVAFLLALTLNKRYNKQMGGDIMQKVLCAVLAFTLLLLLTACDMFPLGIERRDRSKGISYAMPTEPTQTEPVTTEQVKPEHSEFYIPGLEADQVIEYFNEVCLDSEHSSGSGDPTLVQKWEQEIRYDIFGEYTEEDLQVLDAFISWLNTVEGFPGMRRIKPNEGANLRMNFVDQRGMAAVGAPEADGYVNFHYANNVIYEATIYYRKDIEQYTRNSVLQEEIYNGLGPAQDSELRQDSLIYSGFSTPQEPTQIDMLLIQLLYHPDIKAGMNEQECAAVIRQLYY